MSRSITCDRCKTGELEMRRSSYRVTVVELWREPRNAVTPPLELDLCNRCKKHLEAWVERGGDIFDED